VERAEPAPAQAGVATANGFVMAIDPTDRRKDSGLAPGLVEKIAERCGRVPQRLLADTTAMTREDIVKLAERYPDMTVYSPPAAAGAHGRHRRDIAQAALETPPRAAGGPAVARTNGQRGRPTNLPAPQTDRTRARHHQEPRHVRFLVHRREKVRAVCVLQALALNLCWANTLRRRIAAAAAMAIPAIA
jgi:hypothetical protein